jgi:hypothetical protein
MCKGHWYTKTKRFTRFRRDSLWIRIPYFSQISRKYITCFLHESSYMSSSIVQGECYKFTQDTRFKYKFQITNWCGQFTKSYSTTRTTFIGVEIKQKPTQVKRSETWQKTEVIRFVLSVRRLHHWHCQCPEETPYNV